MPAQAITLQLPSPLYEHFKRLAAKARRTIEAEILDAVAHVAPEVEELAPDLAESLSQLEALDDEALWRLARSHLSRQESTELEDLHLKRQSEGLTPGEKARASFLVGHYERAMVLRAHSARVLKERGHDVSDLLRKP